MMSRKIFSSKKMVLHGSVLRVGKSHGVGWRKGKYGKRKKEGGLGDNK